MVGQRAGSREKAFAKRLTQTLDNHPRCPPDYGRLVWVKIELRHQRIAVTSETVRRWLNGTAMPRRDKMAALAKMLSVDETWLAMGASRIKGSEASARIEVLESALREIQAITKSQEIKAIVSGVLD